jgi:hypothetical protein
MEAFVIGQPIVLETVDEHDDNIKETHATSILMQLMNVI